MLRGATMEKKLNQAEYLLTQLSSNPDQAYWPFEGQSKPRKPQSFYAIDVDGITVVKIAADNHDGMRKELARLHLAHDDVVVRFVELTEEDYLEEDRAKSDWRWIEQIYKPAPARRAHR